MDTETILVTGSSGTLGTAVCERLSKGYKVIGLDTKAPKQPATVAEYIYTDLTSEESVEHSMRDVTVRHGRQIASVIHLAAFHSFSIEQNPLYEELTVKGTGRLIHSLQEQGFNAGQLLFSSTMLVHKPTEPGHPIDEDWPMEADWPYPQSKIETEALILREHGGIPAVLMRIAGVYDDYCHSIPISHHIQRIYERDVTSRFHPGDTSHGQAFVHMQDFLDAVESAVRTRAELPPAIPILIGEEDPMSYEEMQKELGRLIYGDEGEDWVTTYIPKTIAKAGAWLEAHTPIGEEDPFIKPFMVDLADHHYELDTSRARRLLGWEPKHSLEQTLPRMVKALKADPVRWYEDHKLEAPDWLGQREPKATAK